MTATPSFDPPLSSEPGQCANPTTHESSSLFADLADLAPQHDPDRSDSPAGHHDGVGAPRRPAVLLPVEYIPGRIEEYWLLDASGSLDQARPGQVIETLAPNAESGDDSVQEAASDDEPPVRLGGDASGVVPARQGVTPASCRDEERPAHAAKRGGRPQGRRTIPPITMRAGPLHVLNGSPAQLYTDAIQAGRLADGWVANEEGRPEYRRRTKTMEGSVTYETLEIALDDAFRDTWSDVANLGTADLQLFMCVSNALLQHPNPTAGILIDVHRYAEARGVSIKATQAEREAFNDSVRRIASLSLRADVVTKVKGGKREVRSIHGRMVIPEVVATTSTGWVTDAKTPITREVTGWRLIPGVAWLTCRERGKIGRYPRALLAMNPHKEGFLIRLGAYLGYQTAVRASFGTLAQPLSIRAILAGIYEPIPTDRQQLHKLRDRFVKAMDDLGPGRRNVITSWEWVGDEPLPAAFPSATIRFLYQGDCLADYSEFYPKAKQAMKRPEVRQLLPAGHGEPAVGNPPSR